MAKPRKRPSDELISIPLHEKHWVIVLAGVEALVQDATRRIKELKAQGVDHSTLPEPMVTALAAPTIVRGILVKALTEHGLMTPEANARMGIDKINEAIQKYRKNV